MKCPKCKEEGCRYKQRKPKRMVGLKKEPFTRTDFTAKCKKCGWEGEA